MAGECCGKNDFCGIRDDCNSLEIPFSIADFAESLFFLLFFKLNQLDSDNLGSLPCVLLNDNTVYQGVDETSVFAFSP